MKQRTFRHKNVVVTGAGGGLGQALCLRFARAGARIGGLDVQQQPLDTIAQAIESQGGVMVTETVDIRRRDDVHRAMGHLAERLGGIDVLINNAGVTHLRNFQSGESGAVQRVMEVNFNGSVHCTDAALDDLIARRGMIITLSSVAGFAPLIGRSGYCASKHALHGFFNTLRLELRRTGVDVLLVCPSFIRTDIRQEFTAEDGNSSGRQTVGAADSPESVADLIYRAARRRRRQLQTGTVGRLSYWLHRLVPRLYETLMVRRIRDEP